MIIAEARAKCKSLLERFLTLRQTARDVLIFGVLILASLLSFGLGYLAGVDAGQGAVPIRMTNPER
jgi:hypothetical protein